MRVGVYLGDYRPDMGGGHVFVESVLEALLRCASRSHHAFTVFAPHDAIDAISVTSPREEVELRGVRRIGVVGKASLAVRHHSPLYRHISRQVSSLDRAIRKSGVEFLWFVGGGAYDSPDTPYLATVWDLQHRTHPWFPEVSSGGRWDYREITQSRFLRRAAHLVTGTETGREQLHRYYQVPHERVSILPHPVPNMPDADALNHDSRLARLIDRKYVFYPAQFWAHKNHVNLILAMQAIRERHGLDVDLVLTGSDKGNESHVRRYAKLLGLEENVHFLGFVSRTELAQVYNSAEALVYVPWSGPENLPPLEAFVQGCPVINADYPGAVEQLGDAAVYVDPGDPSDIADKVAGILTDSALRQQLIERGKRRAGSRTASNYVTGVFEVIDAFGSIRRTWT